jgi:tetratricopeptide (TPR) repeat protein
MKKTAIFILAFVMLSSCLMAQDAKTLLAQADSVFNSGNYSQARDIYMQAANMAQEKGQDSELTEANAMIARSYLIQGEADEGMKYLARTVETAVPDDPLGWSRYLGVRGRFEWNNKNLDKATETFKEMFYYCQEHKLYDRAVDAAHMVAITGNSDEQVEWALKGIGFAEEHDAGSWLGPLWNNLGATYEDRGQYIDALYAYKKAREYHYKYGTERNKLIADWAVGHAYRLADSTNQADSVLTPLLAWSEKLGETEYLGWTNKDLGDIQYDAENYLEAAKYYREALRNLKEAGMEKWDPDQYDSIVQKLEESKIKVEAESQSSGE